MKTGKIIMNKGQAIQGTLVAIAFMSSLVTATGAWIVDHVLSSPQTQAAAVSQLDNRVTVVETKQANTDTTVKNQGNKIDYLVQAMEKIGSKLQVNVGTPPINQ